MPTEEESDLITRARTGDQEAFARLVTEHETQVYNLALRMTGNPDDAAELTQEAFLNAWCGLARFHGESAFATWLYRLTSNACIDFLRKEKRRRTFSLTASEEEGEENQEFQIPDESTSPERELGRREQRRAVADGLKRLSQEHRQVLILREVNGLTYLEISRVLGVGEGTVKSRIARARRALRRILERDGNFFGYGTSEC
ncbi:MAG: sigma-70 family RNA polymerase sigma factor [Intestinimonas sp.]|jgi:RNA polymerase sigma-70 factor (ECF subfamily)|nr:sigma-70 family RNA polymerase sigma factor [Intestinimonas sp.]